MRHLNIDIRLKKPHYQQQNFITDASKRKVVRAGRRSGKTVGVGILAVQAFMSGKRVLYATPTSDQINRFWVTVSAALHAGVQSGILRQNLTEHFIELPDTEQRIRAKTAWNADTLRGDYADLLIMDEFQLMNEDAWAVVGAPMLLDRNGDAVFVYTPPSLHSRSVTKANDPQHAAKLFKKAAADTTGRWKTFHFTSMDNPHISTDALDDITQDMSTLAYRMEILAEDIDEVPGALWRREHIDAARVSVAPDLERIIVGVDPSATSNGDEAGIVTCGKAGSEYYTLGDDSVQGSPVTWASAAVAAYRRHNADLIVGEGNNGGEMIEAVIRQIDPTVNYRMVHASRGKATRAEPIAAIAEKGHDHHVGVFAALEDELCLWTPGDKSPNRLDAKVWAMTELIDTVVTELVDDPFAGW